LIRGIQEAWIAGLDQVKPGNKSESSECVAALERFGLEFGR